MRSYCRRRPVGTTACFMGVAYRPDWQYGGERCPAWRRRAVANRLDPAVSRSPAARSLRHRRAVAPIHQDPPAPVAAAPDKRQPSSKRRPRAVRERRDTESAGDEASVGVTCGDSMSVGRIRCGCAEPTAHYRSHEEYASSGGDAARAGCCTLDLCVACCYHNRWVGFAARSQRGARREHRARLCAPPGAVFGPGGIARGCLALRHSLRPSARSRAARYIARPATRRLVRRHSLGYTRFDRVRADRARVRRCKYDADDSPSRRRGYTRGIAAGTGEELTIRVLQLLRRHFFRCYPLHKEEELAAQA